MGWLCGATSLGWAAHIAVYKLACFSSMFYVSAKIGKGGGYYSQRLLSTTCTLTASCGWATTTVAAERKQLKRKPCIRVIKTGHCDCDVCLCS